MPKLPGEAEVTRIAVIARVGRWSLAAPVIPITLESASERGVVS
jgi:hypothetical protein